MTALAYFHRSGQVWRIGIGSLPDEPITDHEAKTTRSRMIRWANTLADKGEFTQAANAQAVAEELTQALAEARLWLAAHPEQLRAEA